MGHRFAEIAFTPAVRAHQAERGSRAAYARLEQGPPRNDRLGPREQAFVAQRDGFYLASVGEGGWPYVQFRGGPPGFLRVLDERTLGFADLRGNRQYVTLGNLSRDGRVALFLMDYANGRRLKLLGRARAVDAAEDPALVARLAVPGYPTPAERALLVAVEAFDWNCSQHIPRRWTREELAAAGLPAPE
jgi:predicted pyridoxine 5'-phosphate oxidase superfamily flavin-nucleotide-binding protein